MDSNSKLDKELRDKAYRICREHLGGAWSKISSKEMSFTQVTGGMSNLLYCCSLPESSQPMKGEPIQVLLRLYGEASRNSDISLQVQIFELLSNKELGPKLYGNFDGGRLEEFLPAESLTCDELINRDISSIIARKLATVHTLDVPNMDKTGNWVSERLNEWLESLETRRDVPLANGMLESTKKVAKSLLKIDFPSEIRFLTKVLEGTKSPIVFSHNDLHQGNILLVKPTKQRSQLDKRVILIDFEYCSYNYRGYDIANHFSEWCFEYGTSEYPNFTLHLDRFPSKDLQREFIRNYLDQKRKFSSQISSSKQDIISNINNNCDYYRNGSKSSNGSGKLSGVQFSNGHHYHRSCVDHQHASGTKGTVKALKLEATDYDTEVEAILNEVAPFCMASNLVWALWCINNAFSSNIKFGYWEHAMTRWQIYSSLKQSYIVDRTTKRIRTPLANAVANGHSLSSPQLTAASSIPEVSN